jgi:hypothetical protein
MRALDILRPALTQINFEEIAQCYMTFAKPSGGKKLLTDAIQALIKRKERGNKKQSYRDRLDRDLNAFASDFPGSMVNEISQSMIEDWVFDDAWKPITQRNRLRDLHQLFAFALKEKWCGVNPVANIEKPSITWESPVVFTPQETEWIRRFGHAHAGGYRADFGKTVLSNLDKKFHGSISEIAITSPKREMTMGL